MPLAIDAFNKIVQITSPDTEVSAQTLHDFIEDYMASPLGMITDGATPFKGDILKPEGKIEDPSAPGQFSQIILILNPEWQIQFWGGSGYTRIFGGKIVGGVNDQPLKASGTAGDISVLESPVDGVTVQVEGGGDVTYTGTCIEDLAISVSGDGVIAVPETDVLSTVPPANPIVELDPENLVAVEEDQLLAEVC